MTKQEDDEIDLPTIKCNGCCKGRWPKPCWRCGGTGRQFLVAGYRLPLTEQGEIFARAIAKRWGNVELTGSNK